MTELEAIKKRKLAELQAAQQHTSIAQTQANEEAKLAEQMAQLEAMAKQVMTKEAKQRFGTVKLAHPKIAMNALLAILQAMQSGKLRKIDDESLKDLLRTISQKREVKITRK